MADIKKGMQFNDCRSEIENLVQNKKIEDEDFHQINQIVSGKVMFDTCSFENGANTNLVNINKLNDCISKINDDRYVYCFDKAEQELRNIYKRFSHYPLRYIPETEEIGYCSYRFWSHDGTKENVKVIYDLDIDMNAKEFCLFGEIIASRIDFMTKCNCTFTNLNLDIITNYKDESKNASSFPLLSEENITVTELQHCERYNLGMLHGWRNINISISEDVKNFQLKLTCEKIEPAETNIGSNLGYIVFYYSKKTPKISIPIPYVTLP